MNDNARKPSNFRRRRGVAAAIAVLMLAAMSMVITGILNSGEDLSRVTSLRADAMRAFYAAESGVAVVVGELNAGRDIPESLVIDGISEVAFTPVDGDSGQAFRISARNGKATREIRITISGG